MKSWYNIKGQAGDASAEVYILDEIGGFGISAAQFIGEVKALGAKSLTVYIDSPGGDIFGGLAIANWLAGQPNVTTHVLGMAASMANVIAQAGRVRRMAENAYLMTHNPISPYFGGNADDFRDQADWLDRLGNTLSKTIAARTGKTAEVVSKWLDNETWFDAAQAKEANLTDEVMPTAPVQGNFNLARFNAVPQPLQTAMTARNSQPHTIMSKFAALFGLATSTPPPAAPPPAAQAPTDKEKFYGAALESFGIEPPVIAAALADNKPDFASNFIKEKIAGLDGKVSKVDAAFTAAGLAITAADIAEGKKDLKALLEESVAKATARQAAAAGRDPAPPDRTAEGSAGNDDDLDTIRGLIEKEENPEKRACLARRARKARGITSF
ncbi:MAG: hypothetical protein DMF62_03235 [Acidobacteria bacterium]|nr:MAG: hypothetical protein DMF62_03235 [Acidobacteriota bacterium]PYT00186.1 MAG: hypothetical protein DMF63_08390 [Acidobacteriota bacterium]